MKKGAFILLVIFISSCGSNSIPWNGDGIKKESEIIKQEQEKKITEELILENYSSLLNDECILAKVNNSKNCKIGKNESDFLSCVYNSDFILPFICEKEKVSHIKTPEVVKSLYFNSSASNSEKRINDFIELAKKSEVNSITIDVKTVSGYTSFDFPDYVFKGIKPISNNHIKDISSLITKLHENDIYVIARIVLFKDSLLADNRSDLAIKWTNGKDVWSDYNGKKYVDPYSKEVWNYIVDLSKASYELGFDEINYDYVRFPTDGKISSTYYPFANPIIKDDKWGKMKVIDEFSNYAVTTLKEYDSDIVLSADIFGLVTNTNLFQIGQNLESFLLNYDFVGPMIYPSHYGAGFNGYTQPDNNPYEIFTYAISESNRRIDNLNLEIEKSKTSTGELNYKIAGILTPKQSIKNIDKIDKNKVRPWLQGFSCSWCKGATPYTAYKFRRQIDAMNDLGLKSWWVWSSGANYYDDWYLKE